MEEIKLLEGEGIQKIDWIPELQNAYSITSFGRVFSHKRKVARNGGVLQVKGRFLSVKSLSKGYLKIVLKNKNLGYQKSLFIHRLVALAFLLNPEDLPTVNHKDGDSLNNKLENLEWCSWRENSQHAIDTGLIDTSKKSSKFQGVRLDGRSTFRAYVRFNGKTLHIGCFKDEEVAARAYDAFCTKNKIPAKLNFK